MEIWSFCLMPNYVHVVAVPADQDGQRRCFRYVHRHFTGYINARQRTTGHLWQGRLNSVAVDEAHLVTALRYVALNPVRARLVARAEDWRWSSTRAHIAGRDDHVVRVVPALERVGDFAAFLGEAFDEALTYAALRRPSEANRAELKSIEAHRRWVMRTVPKRWKWREDVWCRDSWSEFVTETISTLRSLPDA